MSSGAVTEFEGLIDFFQQPRLYIRGLGQRVVFTAVPRRHAGLSGQVADVGG
jgi:hypothetical protein